MGLIFTSLIHLRKKSLGFNTITKTYIYPTVTLSAVSRVLWEDNRSSDKKFSKFDENRKFINSVTTCP